ncbi:D-sedoheptulose 7-phosphate isomerase [Geminocystis sp. GBBB08]|uniref:D-sedoheptulose 7-phosphate isomerase n=1 Tax=Geminocystis sp. GBBB08 TaxID=2604140 RepID=UPI0027E26A81|nr:D-sedoheptulose 7-phosphate isomerase [Geminocystis sp. GBBB08]MBL1210349.1 D-sedoheptulose 7-phosphate isomerase [Geminocystis sp. GBBB08]
MNSWVQKRLQCLEESFNEEYCQDIDKVIDILASRFQTGHTLLICGNGGSAADAQHIAAEFVGRFQLNRPGLPAIALGTNPATLTAWSNDHEFETIFARQVQSFGKAGDILWVLSTSGKSPNVIQALKVAKERGLITIGMAGNNGGMMNGLIDYPLFVREKNTPYIQEIHLITYHRICEQVEAQLFADQTLAMSHD